MSKMLEQAIIDAEALREALIELQQAAADVSASVEIDADADPVERLGREGFAQGGRARRLRDQRHLPANRTRSERGEQLHIVARAAHDIEHAAHEDERFLAVLALDDHVLTAVHLAHLEGAGVDVLSASLHAARTPTATATIGADGMEKLPLSDGYAAVELGGTFYIADRGDGDWQMPQWSGDGDGLLADDVVDNRVWSGGRFSELLYCPVGGDIPKRKDGRLLVHVGGWLPGGGCEANITLSDEPGSRAVGPVQILVGEERKPMKTENPLPYVAVIITPPPLESVTSHGDRE